MAVLKLSAWKKASLTAAFLVAFAGTGAATIIRFDTYFTDFWKIGECDPDGFAKSDFMYVCPGIKVDRYHFGAIFLGVQKDAVESARNADVLILGNSRTIRSFSTDAIDRYFAEKNLKYFVLAAEGTGWRPSALSIQKLGLTPKILLINNEVFYTNAISEGFQDIVDFPEKYQTRFAFFYLAQRLQRWVCNRPGVFLKEFYCNGRAVAQWRSVRTGRLKWDFVAPPEKQEVIAFDPDSRVQMLDRFMRGANELAGLPELKQTCSILYLVPSMLSSPQLMDNMAQALGVSSVFTFVPGLQTYDKSHMDRPTSERWAEAFVKDLDPAIDACLSQH